MNGKNQKKQTKQRVAFWGWGALACLIAGSGCTPQIKVNNPATTSKVHAMAGCIKGRVLKEDRKGFGGITVITKPHTSFVVTDQFGHFEICHRKVVINKDTSETASRPLEKLKYELKAQRDGHHHRPVLVNYTGQRIKLKDPILLLLKSVQLPDVIQTQTPAPPEDEPCRLKNKKDCEKAVFRPTGPPPVGS